MLHLYLSLMHAIVRILCHVCAAKKASSYPCFSSQRLLATLGTESQWLGWHGRWREATNATGEVASQPIMNMSRIVIERIMLNRIVDIRISGTQSYFHQAPPRIIITSPTTRIPCIFRSHLHIVHPIITEVHTYFLLLSTTKQNSLDGWWNLWLWPTMMSDLCSTLNRRRHWRIGAATFSSTRNFFFMVCWRMEAYFQWVLLCVVWIQLSNNCRQHKSS